MQTITMVVLPTFCGASVLSPPSLSAGSALASGICGEPLAFSPELSGAGEDVSGVAVSAGVSATFSAGASGS